jgi:trans-aconitate 2-methyltransferase
MIEQAQSRAVPGRLEFRVGDARDFAERELDVLVSNATLQWVPAHLELFSRFIGSLAPGGWFAFQVPGMQAQPSHQLLMELATSPRWADTLAGVIRQDPIEPPERYFDALSALGCSADVWETTYFQLLPGEDPVLEWMKGSSLRPALTLLGPADAAEFTSVLSAELREAYPPGPNGTIYPFRRVFAVARLGS